MLEKLLLQNFQCHNKLEIEFDPNVTSIVGSSDRGKSAVIRALFLLAFNHPSGVSFIRDGSKGCSVSLKVDGNLVRRRRSKSVNHYEVNGKKLEAFGRGNVPDEVESALNLSKINFQLQHDSPLWMSESPGQVAKNLNEIVALDLIDRVLSRLNRDFKEAEANLGRSQIRLSQAKSQISDLEWVEDADRELAVIEKIDQEIRSIEDAIEHEQKLLAETEKANTEYASLKFVFKMEEDLNLLNEHIEEIDVMEKEILSYNRWVGRIKSQQEEESRTKNELKKAKAEMSKVSECPLCGQPINSAEDFD